VPKAPVVLTGVHMPKSLLWVWSGFSACVYVCMREEEVWWVIQWTERQEMWLWFWL